MQDAASEPTTLHAVGKIMREQMARTLAISVAEAHLEDKHKQSVWCCPLCPEGTEPFAALLGVEIGSVYLDNLRRAHLARADKK